MLSLALAGGAARAGDISGAGLLVVDHATARLYAIDLDQALADGHSENAIDCQVDLLDEFGMPIPAGPLGVVSSGPFIWISYDNDRIYRYAASGCGLNYQTHATTADTAVALAARPSGILYATGDDNVLRVLDFGLLPAGTIVVERPAGFPAAAFKLIGVTDSPYHQYLELATVTLSNGDQIQRFHPLVVDHLTIGEPRWAAIADQGSVVTTRDTDNNYAESVYQRAVPEAIASTQNPVTIAPEDLASAGAMPIELIHYVRSGNTIYKDLEVQAFMGEQFELDAGSANVKREWWGRNTHQRLFFNGPNASDPIVGRSGFTFDFIPTTAQTFAGRLDIDGGNLVEICDVQSVPPLLDSYTVLDCEDWTIDETTCDPSPASGGSLCESTADLVSAQDAVAPGMWVNNTLLVPYPGANSFLLPAAMIDPRDIDLRANGDAASAAPDVEFVDPVTGVTTTSLLAGQEITQDYDRLSTGGRVVDGIAADGAAKLLIRLHTDTMSATEVTFSLDPADGAIGVKGNADQDGSLSELDQQNLTADKVTVQSRDDGAGHIAYAIYNAPRDFVRGDSADRLSGRRPLTLALEIDGTPSTFSVQVQGQPYRGDHFLVVRPPVALVHGLWSQRETWDWSLETDSRFTVYVADYQLHHAAPILTNVVRAREGTLQAIYALRARGIAVAAADYVGHSMGGLIGRRYISNFGGYYAADSTYGDDAIHKFLTLNTPHLGSPLADELVNPDGSARPLGFAFEYLFGNCVVCGAVADLRPDSTVITTMPGITLPIHALVGKGGSDLVAMGLEQALNQYPPTKFLALLLKVASFLGIELFPPALQHDLIVGRQSQEGGLGTGSIHTSVFGFQGFLPLELGVHITATIEDRINDRAVDLLHASATDPFVFAGGFPANKIVIESTPTATPLVWTLKGPSAGIAITSPSPGAVVTAGSQVSVTVVETGGFVAASVLIGSMFGAEQVDAPPYEALLEVPIEALGPMQIAALARDGGGNLVFANPVTLQVDAAATLTGIRVGIETLHLFAFSPQTQLTVMGSFDDGVDRDVTASSAGTAYQSGDANVLTVDAEGLITTAHVGSTVVTVSNGGHVLQLPVSVHTARFDFNSDGQVDEPDLAAFGTCHSGPDDAPGFVTPSVACRDVFDADEDSDVDLDDLDAFLLIYTGVIADCNGNMVLDLIDVLTGSSPDVDGDGVPDECAFIFADGFE